MELDDELTVVVILDLAGPLLWSCFGVGMSGMIIFFSLGVAEDRRKFNDLVLTRRSNSFSSSTVMLELLLP